jgi:Tol biopolymer transport system component
MKGLGTALFISSILVVQTTADPFPVRSLDIPYEAGSPDGAFAVYHKDGVATRLYVRDVRTGAERVLVDADGRVTNPVWSTDSRLLAFTVTNPTTRVAELRVVAADGGQVRTVAATASAATWTIRNEVVFSKPNPAINGSDWLVAPADGTGTPKRIYAQNQDAVVAIAPDASAVVLNQRGQLVLDEVATGAERSVAGGIGIESAPTFSPDGKLLAFFSDRDGHWALHVTPLDKIPAAHPLKIANFDSQPLRSAAWWTNDGRLAVRATYDDDALYRVDLDPSAHVRAPAAPLKQDTTVVHDFVVRSPDGRRVAYQYSMGSKIGVGVAESDGSGERRVIERDRSGPAAGVQPLAWRSADELLLYDSIASPGGLYALNVSSGASTVVAALDLGDSDSAYVAASRELVYAAGSMMDEAGQLKIRSIASGKERTIATVGYLIGFAVSGDGRHVAYTRWTARPGANVPVEMKVMAIDGTPEKTLLAASPAFCLPAAWSPDGANLLYLDRGTIPRVIRIADGQSWPLFDAPGPTSWRSANVSWSADGVLLMPGHQARQEAQARVWEGVTYEAVSRLMGRGAGR